MKQEWFNIPGMSENYQIHCKTHKIRSIGKWKRCRELSEVTDKTKGYVIVRMNHANYYKHRIIALMFIPNPLGLPQVNHKNGVKSDNSIENLEWVTAKQNVHHAHSMGLIKRKRISEFHKQRLSDIKNKQVFDMSNGCTYRSISDAAFVYDIPLSTLSLMLNGKTINKTPLRIKNSGQNISPPGNSGLADGQDNDMHETRMAGFAGAS